MHVTTNHRTAIAWLLSPLLALSAGCSGCSNHATQEPADASVHDAPLDHHLDVRDAGHPDAPRDTGVDVHDSGKDAIEPLEAGDCGYIPRPADVPDGWVAMPAVDCQHIIYAPPDLQHLPKPLTWIPCPSGYVPDSYQCRAIRMDWENTQVVPPFGIGLATPGYVEPNGTVVLGLNLSVEHDHPPNLPYNQTKFSNMAEVVEADGQVRQALWQSDTKLHSGPTQTLHIMGIGSGKSMFSVENWDGNLNVDRTICLGGDDTLLQPRAYEDNHEGSGLGYCMPSHYGYWITGRSNPVKDWDRKLMGMAIDIGSPAFSPLTWVGPNLLFALESGDSYALRMWSKDKGTYPLVDYGAGSGHGAGNPASDGKDLVWIEGTDWSDDLPGFTNRWVTTSKYSPDPTKIKPRHLTHWPYRVIGTHVRPGVVGCGYAAYPLVDTEDPNNVNKFSSVFLVRLSDGAFWETPNVMPEDPGFTWGLPVAVTCDELFVTMHGRFTSDKYAHSSVFRIRIDSMGPPSPPVL